MSDCRLLRSSAYFDIVPPSLLLSLHPLAWSMLRARSVNRSCGSVWRSCVRPRLRGTSWRWLWLLAYLPIPLRDVCTLCRSSCSHCALLYFTLQWYESTFLYVVLCKFYLTLLLNVMYSVGVGDIVTVEAHTYSLASITPSKLCPLLTKLKQLWKVILMRL